MSPTQRTLRELKGQGRVCAIVEKWNPYVGPPRSPSSPVGQKNKPTGIRQDLFGIIDVLSLDPVRGFVGVQCCAGSGMSAHWTKLTVDRAQESLDWLKTPGGRLEIWAWRKVKVKRGGKAMVWRPRIVEVTAEDIVG